MVKDNSKAVAVQQARKSALYAYVENLDAKGSSQTSGWQNFKRAVKVVFGVETPLTETFSPILEAKSLEDAVEASFSFLKNCIRKKASFEDILEEVDTRVSKSENEHRWIIVAFSVAFVPSRFVETGNKKQLKSIPILLYKLLSELGGKVFQVVAKLDPSLRKAFVDSLHPLIGIVSYIAFYWLYGLMGGKNWFVDLPNGPIKPGMLDLSVNLMIHHGTLYKYIEIYLKGLDSDMLTLLFRAAKRSDETLSVTLAQAVLDRFVHVLVWDARSLAEFASYVISLLSDIKDINLKEVFASLRTRNVRIELLKPLVLAVLSKDKTWGRFLLNEESLWAASLVLCESTKSYRDAASVSYSMETSAQLTPSPSPSPDVVRRVMQHLLESLRKAHVHDRYEILENLRVLMKSHACKILDVGEVMRIIMQTPVNSQKTVVINCLKDLIGAVCSTWPSSNEEALIRVKGTITEFVDSHITFVQLLKAIEPTLKQSGSVVKAIVDGIVEKALQSPERYCDAIDTQLLVSVSRGPNGSRFFGELLGLAVYQRMQSQQMSWRKLCNLRADVYLADLARASKYWQASTGSLRNWLLDVKNGRIAPATVHTVHESRESVELFENLHLTKRGEYIRAIDAYMNRWNAVKKRFGDALSLLSLLERCGMNFEVSNYDEHNKSLAANEEVIRSLESNLATEDDYENVLDLAIYFCALGQGKGGKASSVFRRQLDECVKALPDDKLPAFAVVQAFELTKTTLGGSSDTKLIDLITKKNELPKTCDRAHEMRMVSEYCKRRAIPWNTLDSEKLKEGEAVIGWQNSATRFRDLLRKLRARDNQPPFLGTLDEDVNKLDGWSQRFPVEETLVEEAGVALQLLYESVRIDNRTISIESLAFLEELVYDWCLEDVLFHDMRENDSEFATMVTGMRNNAASSEEDLHVLKDLQFCRDAYSNLVRCENGDMELSEWLEKAERIRAQDGVARIIEARQNIDKLKILIERFENDSMNTGDITSVEILGEQAFVTYSRSANIVLDEVLSRLKQTNDNAASDRYFLSLLSETRKILPTFVKLAFQTACPIVSAHEPFRIFESADNESSFSTMQAVNSTLLSEELSEMDIKTMPGQFKSAFQKLDQLRDLAKEWLRTQNGLGRMSLATSSQVRLLQSMDLRVRSTQISALTEFCGLPNPLDLSSIPDWRDSESVFRNLAMNGSSALNGGASTFRLIDMKVADSREDLLTRAFAVLSAKKHVSPAHLLMCSPVIRPYDVESFSRRVSEVPSDAFVVLCPDRLNSLAQRTLVTSVSNLRSSRCGGTLAIAYEDHEVHTALSKALGDSNEATVLASTTSLRLLLEPRVVLQPLIVTGPPGFGKSYFVRATALNTKAEYVHLPVNETFTADCGAREVIERLKASAPHSQLFVHIDISGGEAMLDREGFFAKVSENERLSKVTSMGLTRPLEELEKFILHLCVFGFLFDNQSGTTIELRNQKAFERLQVFVELPGEESLKVKFVDRLVLVDKIQRRTVDMRSDRQLYVPGTAEELFACHVLVNNGGNDWNLNRLNRILLDKESNSLQPLPNANQIIEELMPCWSRRRQRQVLFTLSERFESMIKLGRFEALKAFPRSSFSGETINQGLLSDDLQFDDIQLAFVIQQTMDGDQARTDRTFARLGPKLIRQTLQINDATNNGLAHSLDELILICGDENEGSSNLRVRLRGEPSDKDQGDDDYEGEDGKLLTLQSGTEAERRHVLATALGLTSASSSLEEMLREMNFALEAQTTFRLLTQIEARASRSCVIWSGGTGIGKSEGSRVLTQLLLARGSHDFAYEAQSTLLQVLFADEDRIVNVSPIVARKFMSVGGVRKCIQRNQVRGSTCGDPVPAVFVYLRSKDNEIPLKLNIQPHPTTSEASTAVLKIINEDDGSACEIRADLHCDQPSKVILGCNGVNAVVAKVWCAGKCQMELSVTVDNVPVSDSRFIINYEPTQIGDDLFNGDPEYVDSIGASGEKFAKCLTKSINEITDGDEKDKARTFLGGIILDKIEGWISSLAVVPKIPGRVSLAQQLDKIRLDLEKAPTTRNFERALCLVDEIRLPSLMFKLCLHPSTETSDLEHVVGRAVARLARILAWADRERISFKSSLIATVFLDELNTSPFPGLIKQLVLDRHLNGKPLSLLGKEFKLDDNLGDISDDLFESEAYRHNNNDHRAKMATCLDQHYEEAAQAIFFVGAINPPMGVDETEAKHERHALFTVGALPEALNEVTRPFGELEDGTIEKMASSLLQTVKFLTNNERDDIATLIREAHRLVTAFRVGDKSLNIPQFADMDKCWASIRHVVRTVRLLKFFLEHPRLLFAPNSQANELAGSLVTENSSDGLCIRRKASLLSIFCAYWFQLTRVRSSSSDEAADLRLIFCILFRQSTVFQRWCSERASPRLKIAIENKPVKVFMVEQMNCVVERMQPLLSAQHALTLPLLEHLFTTFVCSQSCIPILMVGPPGCSKTLAANIVLGGCLDEHRLNRELFPGENLCKLSVRTFQCSDQSTAAEIEALFRHVQEDSKGIRTIGAAFIDEASLAPRALKSAHEPLDAFKVAAVINSNLVLDAAKTNRCLMVRRDPIKDDQEDLSKLAISTVGLSRNTSLSDHPVLKGLVQAYCSLVSDHGPAPYTFHLRHFIYLMRSLRRTNGYASNPVSVAQALARNFGGLPEAEFERCVGQVAFSAIANACQESDDPAEQWRFPPEGWSYDALEMAEILIKGETYALQDGETFNPNLHAPRNVLLITSHEGFHWFGMLWNKAAAADGRSISDETVSMFPEENDSIGRESMVGRVAQKMGDKNLVFIHGGDQKVFGAFYDAFNMRFEKNKESWRVNVGIGSLWKSCRYHPQFRAVVVLDRATYDAMRTKDSTMLPFLSRFEAIHLSPAALIASTAALQRLHVPVDSTSLQWLTGIVHKVCEFASKSCALMLAGLDAIDPWEVSCAVLLHVFSMQQPGNNNSASVSREPLLPEGSSIEFETSCSLVEQCANVLLRMARPEALCLRSRVAKWLSENYLETYLDDILDHFSAARSLHAMQNEPNVYRSFLITRSVPLLSDPDSFSELIGLPVLCVEHCDTARMLHSRLIGYHDSPVVVLTMNLAFVSSVQLEHVCRIVESMEYEYSRRCAIIVHRSSEEIAYDQVPAPRFAGWRSGFVDDVKGLFPKTRPRSAILRALTNSMEDDDITDNLYDEEFLDGISKLVCERIDVSSLDGLLIDPDFEQLSISSSSRFRLQPFLKNLFRTDSCKLTDVNALIVAAAEDKLKGIDVHALEETAHGALRGLVYTSMARAVERIAMPGYLPALLKLLDVNDDSTHQTQLEFVHQILRGLIQHDQASFGPRVSANSHFIKVSIAPGTLHSRTPMFFAWVDQVRKKSDSAILSWHKALDMEERARLDGYLWIDILRLIALTPAIPITDSVSISTCLLVAKVWLESQSANDIFTAVVHAEQEHIQQQCQDLVWSLGFVTALAQIGRFTEVSVRELAAQAESFDAYFDACAGLGFGALIQPCSDEDDEQIRREAIRTARLLMKVDPRLHAAFEQTKCQELVEALVIGDASLTFSWEDSPRRPEESSLDRLRTLCGALTENDPDSAKVRLALVQGWFQLDAQSLRSHESEVISMVVNDEFNLQAALGPDIERVLLNKLYDVWQGESPKESPAIASLIDRELEKQNETNSFKMLLCEDGRSKNLARAKHRAHHLVTSELSFPKLIESCCDRYRSRGVRRVGKSTTPLGRSFTDAFLISDIAYYLGRVGQDTFESQEVDIGADTLCMMPELAKKLLTGEDRKKWFIRNVHSQHVIDQLLKDDSRLRTELGFEEADIDLIRQNSNVDMAGQGLPGEASLDDIHSYNDAMVAQKIWAERGLTLLDAHKTLSRLAQLKGWPREMEWLGETGVKSIIHDHMNQGDAATLIRVIEEDIKWIGEFLLQKDRLPENYVACYNRRNLADLLGTQSSPGLLKDVYAALSTLAFNVCEGRPLRWSSALAKSPLNWVSLGSIAASRIRQSKFRPTDVDDHVLRLDGLGLTLLAAVQGYGSMTCLKWLPCPYTMDDMVVNEATGAKPLNARTHVVDEDENLLVNLNRDARKLGELCSFNSEPLPNPEERAMARRFFESVNEDTESYVARLLEFWEKPGLWEGSQLYAELGSISLRSTSCALLDGLLTRQVRLDALDVVLKSQPLPDPHAARVHLLSRCKKQPRACLRAFQRMFHTLLLPKTLDHLASNQSLQVRTVFQDPSCLEVELIPPEILASMLCDWLLLVQKVAAMVKVKLIAKMDSVATKPFDADDIEEFIPSGNDRLLHRTGAFDIVFTHQENEDYELDLEETPNVNTAQTRQQLSIISQVRTLSTIFSFKLARGEEPEYENDHEDESSSQVASTKSRTLLVVPWQLPLFVLSMIFVLIVLLRGRHVDEIIANSPVDSDRHGGGL